MLMQMIMIINYDNKQDGNSGREGISMASFGAGGLKR